MTSSDPRSRTRLRTAFALLLFGLVPPLQAAAQINIESLRTDDPPPGISGTLGGDLDVKTGNTDFVQLGLSSRINWVRGRTTTLLIGDGGLGFQGGNRFSSSGLLHLRRTDWLYDRVGAEAYGQLNYDRQQRLSFRVVAGGGVRFRLTQGEWGAVGTGTSIMLEHERLDLPDSDSHDRRTETLRNSTFVTARFVGGEGLVVSSTTYLQPALFDASDDLRVVENLSVAASLTEQLALSVNFDMRYDSDPPDAIASLDTRLRTGLTFTY